MFKADQATPVRFYRDGIQAWKQVLEPELESARQLTSYGIVVRTPVLPRALFVALVCLFNIPVAQAQWQLADEAIRKKDYPAVRAACEPQQYVNTPGCEAALGYLYRYGLGGVTQDHSRAHTLSKSAAEKGNPRGLTMLAHMHRTGDFVARDYETAMRLYEQAGKMGSTDATVFIGVMHMEGLGVPLDPIAGCKFFKSAADRGNPYAMAKLAICWRGGLGDYAKDPKKALELAKMASSKGNALGAYIAGVMLRRGEGIKADPAEAANQLRSVFDSPVSIPSSRDPHRDANLELGLMALTGSGVPQDWPSAEKHFEVAAGLGSTRAMAQLGNMYRLGGPGFSINFPKAIQWLSAAIAGTPTEGTALHAMARMHHNGQGMPADPVKARILYEQAAALDVPDSKLFLASFLDGGIGGSVDRARATLLLREALASKSLHPDNRKLGQGWMERADRGLAFTDRPTSTAAASSPPSAALAAERMAALEESSRRESEDRFQRARNEARPSGSGADTGRGQIQAAPSTASPSTATAPASVADQRLAAFEESSRRERSERYQRLSTQPLPDPSGAAQPQTPNSNRPIAPPPNATPATPVSAVLPPPGSALSGAAAQGVANPAEMAEQLRRMQQQLAELQAQANQRQVAAESAPVAANKPTTPAVFANRRALVIGNDQYAHVAPLKNAVADARAISRQLQEFGYRVSLHMNVSEKGFKQALRDFRSVVEGGDEVVFFFAGHGVQLGAANFLLPVDVRGDNEEQVKDEAIQLQRVLDDMQERKVKFTLAIVDACRDNPFKGSGRAIGGRGLAPTTAATGQMIMFSAGSGQQALDKLGLADKSPNGLFTRVFLQEMARPGQPVDRVLRKVREEVVKLARTVGHEQTPALYDQVVGEFFFKQ